MRISACLLTCLLALWANGVEASFNGTIHIKNNTGSSILNLVLTRGTWPNGTGGFWGLNGTIAPGATVSWSINSSAAFWVNSHPHYWVASAPISEEHVALTSLDGFTFNMGPAGPTIDTYTATVTNDQLSTVTAYWKQDGVIVKQVSLAPGATDSYTFEWENGTTPTLDWGYEIYDFQGFDVERDVVELGSADENDAGGASTNIIDQTYTTVNTTNIVNSGPLNWGSSTGDDVNKEGFSSLAAINQVGNEEILKELKRIREEQDDQGDQARNPTNGVVTSQMSAQESDANLLATSEVGSFKTWTENNSISGGSDSGGALLNEQLTIAKGNFSYTLNLSGTQKPWMATAMSALKTALAWIIALTLFVKNWKCLEDTMHAQFQINQVGTVGQEILGTNVKLPAAIIAAAVIVAALATVPTVAVAYLDIAGIDGVNPLASWAGGSAVWSHALYYINLMFPVGTVLTAIASHLTFRLVLLGLFAFWGSVIKAMVGL